MARLSHRLSIATALLVVATFTNGCSSDGTASPSASLVATWNVTHFNAMGSDFIALGMTMTATFTSSNTYSFVVTNDLVDSCGGTANCTDTGTYSATETQITLNPATVDAVTFTYGIAGNTMTWTGSIDGNAVSVTMVKQ